MMKILIIEDEARAANQLQNMLKSCDFHFDLLDIIDSVEDSVLWFENNSAPDLVFMDIQLADGLSFEVFQKTRVEAPIIFTTAFDQYAIQAFKVNSIDYLLKPIQKDDLDLALAQFNKIKISSPLQPELIKSLLDNLQIKTYRKGVLVKKGGGFVQIKVSDLKYVYSEGGITFGVTKDGRFIIEETLDQFLNTLNNNDFYRINRGQVVAKNAVQKIEPYFNHRIKLSIDHPRDQEFVVSRQRSSDFKKWMNR